MDRSSYANDSQMRCKLGFRAKNHRGFCFSFLSFFFFFSFSFLIAIALRHLLPGPLPSAQQPLGMCFPQAATGQGAAPSRQAPALNLPRTGELVNCAQVGDLGGEQACGPCQGEKAPSPLHRDSHPGVFPPFLLCTQGKSNAGMLQGHLSAKLVHCKSLDCLCIYLSPKDLGSNPDTTTDQLCDSEQTT